MRKHAEMIEAWARNKDLVVFVKHSSGWKQIKPSWMEDMEYFACLPQHAKECERWLNGGSLQIETPIGMGAKWVDIVDYSDGCRDWHPEHFFMCKHSKHRVKVKKEKRWIGVFKDKMPLSGDEIIRTTQLSYESIDELKRGSHAPNGFDGWQFIQIEVEV